MRAANTSVQRHPVHVPRPCSACEQQPVHRPRPSRRFRVPRALPDEPQPSQNEPAKLAIHPGNAAMVRFRRHAGANTRGACMLVCSECLHSPWHAQRRTRQRPHHRPASIYCRCESRRPFACFPDSCTSKKIELVTLTRMHFRKKKDFRKRKKAKKKKKKSNSGQP